MQVDIYELRDLLEQEYDWNYCESEGPGCIRFDFRRGELSLWIYETGSADGHCPASMKEHLVKAGVEVEHIKFV